MSPDESFSDSMFEKNGRKTLELLEEQINSMGSACPQELLDAYDDLARMLHKMR